MTSSAKIPMIPPVRCNCARIRRAARNVTRFYDACLAPVGITASRFTLLGYLEHQGPMRMGQLAELLAMDMDRATLGHNLRPLERDGLWKSYRTKKIAELGWRQSLRPGAPALGSTATRIRARFRRFEGGRNAPDDGRCRRRAARDLT
jgi:hypothetical protein